MERVRGFNQLFLEMIYKEAVAKRPLLSDIFVPDARDLRFASTGSNFGTLVTRSEASALTFSAILEILHVFLWLIRLRRIAFLDLEQISADFEIEHFETAS